MMVPDNTVVAMGSEKEKTDYDYADNVTFHVFGLADGVSACSKVYDRDGIKKLEFVCERRKDVLTLRVFGEGRFKVCLRNCEVSEVEGGAFQKEENNVLIIPDNECTELRIKF